MRSMSLERPVVLFLVKMVAVYAAWFVLYDLWLLPAGHLDAVVGRSAAVLSGDLLRAIGLEPIVDGRIIRFPSGSGVWVADACTGLTVVGIFAGFVLAFPGRWHRRVAFLAFGVVAIHLANVVRIAALAWLRDVNPELFVPVHEWGATPFFYALVFGLWMIWVRWGGVGEHQDDGTSTPSSERVAVSDPLPQ